jgi:DNA polymerase I-like protein with 3'-5' exonuclease and polymerase domains
VAAEEAMITGWDTETFLIAPGMAAPKLVCVSYDDYKTSGVILRPDGVSLFRSWLADPNVTLVAHNAAFDLGVLCATDPTLVKPVFTAVKEGRIRCTLVREKMIANAKGELKFRYDAKLQKHVKMSFSLAALAQKYLGEVVAKGEDTWRLRYGLLDGVPVADWPQDAYEYARNDARLTRLVFTAQSNEEKATPGEVGQTLAAFCLNLMRIWGVRTDPVSTAKLKVTLEREYAEARAAAEECGLIRGKRRNLKAIRARVEEVYKSHAVEAPQTKKKNVSTSRDTLTMKLYPTWEKDRGLQAIADLVKKEKVLKTYVPVLEAGTLVPITPDWNFMVETYRTSCARPNLQNPPRGGAVRSCFVPRPGYVYVFCDYSTLEMRTLAQVCMDFFKFSEMAKSINEGRDLHLDMASQLLGLPYDEVEKLYIKGDKRADEARQFAKIVDFGAPGGMGAKSLIDYARGYDVEISFPTAEALIKKFCERWSEMKEYFKKCSSLCSQGGEADSVYYGRTGLTRGLVGYTALCNHFFQHLAAVGAKDALCRVVEECYTDEHSPLWGCRPVIFAHDEIGMEVPCGDVKRASESAARLATVMIETMQRWCPDVRIDADAVMMRRWLKGAKPVHVDGILVPSRPEKQGERTVWVADVEARRVA